MLCKLVRELIMAFTLKSKLFWLLANVFVLMICIDSSSLFKVSQLENQFGLIQEPHVRLEWIYGPISWFISCNELCIYLDTVT